jgi:hypothetical protein
LADEPPVPPEEPVRPVAPVAPLDPAPAAVATTERVASTERLAVPEAVDVAPMDARAVTTLGRPSPEEPVWPGAATANATTAASTMPAAASSHAIRRVSRNKLTSSFLRHPRSPSSSSRVMSRA